MTANTPSMYAHIRPFIKTIIGICRFERGPQALPRSLVLLSASLIFYTLARIVVGLFTLPGKFAVLSGLIDTALLTLIVIVALWIRHLYHRAMQTLSGCFVAGSVVSVLIITGYSIASMAPVPRLVLGIGHTLTFPLIMWNIALNAHILREALSTRLAVGFFVSLVYLVLLWQMMQHVVKGTLSH